MPRPVLTPITIQESKAQIIFHRSMRNVSDVLLMNDFLGNFCWFGGISRGVRADARIMKELGPPLTKIKPCEAHLLGG